MAGRPGKYRKEEILDILTSVKDDIICNGKVLPSSNSIWSNLRESLPLLTEKAIYTFALKNKETFISTIIDDEENDNEQECEDFHETPDLTTANDDDISDYMGSDLPKYTDGQFDFTQEEWDKVKPIEKCYKRSDTTRPFVKSRQVFVLPKGKWCSLINEKIWESTRLQCTWIFKRARVSLQGQTYISIIGTCKQCSAHIMMQMDDEPQGTCGLSMNFQIYKYTAHLHTKGTKRRLAGEERNLVVKKILSSNTASSVWRTERADEIMTENDLEPAHLYNIGQLRQAAHEIRRKERFHDDPILALVSMKYLTESGRSIRNICYDKFFVHYWSDLQLQVWNSYTINSSYSTLQIDATGSVVKRLERPADNRSNTILFYHGVTHDGHSQFPVLQMLSERHDTTALQTWMLEWVRSGAKLPKETIMDGSLALLGAAARAFALCPNLEAYISICAAVLRGEAIEVPASFLWIDVAHVMHSISQ